LSLWNNVGRCIVEKSNIIYACAFLFSIGFAILYQNQQIQKVRSLDSLLVQKFGHRSVKILWFSLILFAPVFIAAVRWAIGSDFVTYWSIFLDLQNSNILESLINSREPLYTALNILANFLFGQEWGIFLLSSLITMLFILLTAEYYKKYLSIAMVLLIYFLLFYILSLNIVRQMIALSIILYAFRFILEKKPIKYFIMVIISVMFHQSAIICLLFYFLNIQKESKFWRTKTIIYYLLIILSPIYISLILKLAEHLPFLSFYFNLYPINYNGLGLGFLIEVLPVIVPAMLFRKRLLELNPNFIFFINLSLLTFPLRISGYYILWAYRLMFYASIVQIIIVPIVLNTIQVKTKRIFAYCLFIIVYLAYYVFRYSILNTGEAYPYLSIIPFLNSK